MTTLPSSTVSRRTFMRSLAGAGAVLSLAQRGAAAEPAVTTPGMVGFKAPKLDRVRVGFIGVGARGSGHVSQMMTLDGVDVIAICDNHPPTLARSIANVVKKGRTKPAEYGNGDEDYKRMLERKDIDIVIIATPWQWHARMCVDAMKAGKHAFTEVPAALTVEECWELVDTSERTGKYCMMMENCCYGREELFCLNIVRQGLLGELLHAEAAYVHELRGQMNEVAHGTGSWRTFHYAKRNGNSSDNRWN